MTTSAHERATRDHATIGDALIFMTKALAVVLLILGIGVIVWLWAITQDGERRQALSQQVSVLRLEVADRDATIADLGSKLNTCLAGQIERLERRGGDQ